MVKRSKKPSEDELEDQELENQEDDETPDGEDDDDEAEGRKFTQADLDEKISKRLKSEKARIKREVSDEIRAELEEELETEQAQAAGDLQKLLDKANSKIEKLEAQVQQFESDQAENELEKLKTSIALKEGLPETSIEYIKGSDEAEIKASVKGLITLLGAREAPDGDQGKSVQNSGSRKRKHRDDDKADYEDTAYWRQDI